MKKIAIISLTLVLAACVSTPKKTHLSVYEEFNLYEHLLKNGEGSARITGNAFLRQRGGAVVTCAGSEVRLLPDTAYTQNRLMLLYGNLEHGINLPQPNVTIDPVDVQYISSTKSTRCNSNGDFEIDNIAAGTYYVITSVTWFNGQTQGGALMQKVELKDAELKKIIITEI